MSGIAGVGTLYGIPMWASVLATLAFLLTVVISGVAVVVGMGLTPPESISPYLKEVMKAGGAATVAFLGGFISWIGEKDNTRVADRIRRTFWASYDREKAGRVSGKKSFATESRAELAVFSGSIEGNEGWGLSSWWGRAKIIAQELRSGGSDGSDPKSI